jgi:hypothetical protein
MNTQNTFTIRDANGGYHGTVTNRLVAEDEADYYAKKLGIPCHVVCN